MPIPNRHDGENFSMIMAHPQGAEIFSAWVLLLQVASRCQPRGTLLRDSKKPHTSASLAIKTRAPENWFILALDFLENNTDWLEIEQNCHDDDRQPPSPYQEGVIEGKGRKGIEGKGREEQPAPEIPTESQAVTLTATAGIPEDFSRFVYQDWSSRSGKDAGGVLVNFLPYVTKRWAREQVEWKAKTHKGTKTHENNNRIAPRRVDRNKGTLNEGHAADYAAYTAKS